MRTIKTPRMREGWRGKTLCAVESPSLLKCGIEISLSF